MIESANRITQSSRSGFSMGHLTTGPHELRELETVLENPSYAFIPQIKQSSFTS